MGIFLGQLQVMVQVMENTAGTLKNGKKSAHRRTHKKVADLRNPNTTVQHPSL